MKIYQWPPLPQQSEITALLTSIAASQSLPVQSFAILDFPADNVDSAAWVELIADVGPAIKKVHIFMSSGEPLYLGVGGVGSEVSAGIIMPGGNGLVDWGINAGSRISIKAVNAVTVNAGSILVNFLG